MTKVLVGGLTEAGSCALIEHMEPHVRPTVTEKSGGVAAKVIHVTAGKRCLGASPDHYTVQPTPQKARGYGGIAGSRAPVNQVLPVGRYDT